MFETVLGHHDGVRPAAPLPHQPGPWPHLTVALGNNAAIRFQLSGQCHQFTLRRLAEAATGKLLHAIRDGAN